jgi:hypothetical protein
VGVIVRKIRDRRVWDHADGSPDEAAAIEDFTLREDDVDGISVYEVSSEADRKVVLAALAYARDNTNPIDLVEIDRHVVEGFGSLTPTTAGSPVLAANALHRSLDWSQSRLYDLARALFAEQVAVIRYKAGEVKQAVRDLHGGDLAPEALDFVRRYQR